jgi:hypothetical protein
MDYREATMLGLVVLMLNGRRQEVVFDHLQALANELHCVANSVT